MGKRTFYGKFNCWVIIIKEINPWCQFCLCAYKNPKNIIYWTNVEGGWGFCLSIVTEFFAGIYKVLYWLVLLKRGLPWLCRSFEYTNYC